MKKNQTSAQYPPNPTDGVAQSMEIAALIRNYSRSLNKLIQLLPGDEPEKSRNSILELFKQSIEDEMQANKSNPNGDDEDGQDDIKPIINLDSGDGRPVTYEELRQRLLRRMEEVQEIEQSLHCSMEERRENRGGGDDGSKSEKKQNQQEKRKRVNEAQNTFEIIFISKTINFKK